ncbi:unnamed protein product [Effrenium voratum]|uniref:Uncharacterized protein n=1 Tax=Effrenium voratum TaxID=2562239 RepID=A0AA36N7T8_9DINO|nr:unnamed protein product [Effrenium voratum]
MAPTPKLPAVLIPEHLSKAPTTWRLQLRRQCRTAAAAATAVAAEDRPPAWDADPVAGAGSSASCRAASTFGPPKTRPSFTRSTNLWWWTFAHTSTTRCGAPPALARPIPSELRARGGSGGSGGSGSAGFGSTKSGGQNAESTTRAERRLLLVLHPWPRSCQFLSFGSGLDMFDLQAILRASSQPVCVCCVSLSVSVSPHPQPHKDTEMISLMRDVTLSGHTHTHTHIYFVYIHVNPKDNVTMKPCGRDLREYPSRAPASADVGILLISGSPCKLV